ncbi:ferrous iron transport protein B [Planctomycetota bacterium]
MASKTKDFKKLTVALAGNPNSGKTTIFNALTGARQHVGNYPGVTVEKKEGTCRYRDYEIRFVDLPGTYSLTAHSIEEVVARNFIIDEHPDVVVDVVDASNFERNLYLATQLLEMKVPLILALNMSDMAKKQGFSFDDEKIGTFFGAHVVHTVGSKGKGMDTLLETIVARAEAAEPPAKASSIHYGEDIDKELNHLESLVEQEHHLAQKYGPKWLALKLLEQDKDILDKGHRPEVLAAVDRSVTHLEKLYGDSPEVVVAERRYGFVSGVYEQAVQRTAARRHDVSDLVDKVLLNRVFGMFIFFGMMYAVFWATFTLGAPLMGWIEAGFGWTAEVIARWWPAESNSLLKSLIVDGIIGGVGGVIVFLPNIVLLFLGIALLEDTGYMARAAFLMDRIMNKMGLHGKSFIPMMIGFGCSVPAIMGTRILEDRKSRLTTILVLPLMSCGARLPIYVLFTSAFFAPQWRGLVMWMIYLVGIVLAIVSAVILRHTLLKGETGTFLMELPPYRMPTLRGLLIHMWERSWLYVKKAGTVILVISIVLWAAMTFPRIPEDKVAGLESQAADTAALQYSLAGRIGLAMEPVIKPMGFDYRIGTALIGALAAKEVFVAQMGIVFAVGAADEESLPLQEKLAASYTPLQGLCVMLFCLISAPCMATLAICRRETNSWGWAMFQFWSLTVIAYGVTFTVYQVGRHLV